MISEETCVLCEVEAHHEDPHSPMRGILLATALGALFWLAAYWIFVR